MTEVAESPVYKHRGWYFGVYASGLGEGSRYCAYAKFFRRHPGDLFAAVGVHKLWCGVHDTDQDALNSASTQARGFLDAGLRRGQRW